MTAGANIVLSDEDEILLHKVETRLAKNQKAFDTEQKKGRPNILSQINIDSLNSDRNPSISSTSFKAKHVS